MLIGSRAARHGTRGQSAYAAAKAGLVGLAQSLAKEYGARNIRCNVVLPGFLETRMTAGLSARRREEAREEHALGRFNTVGNAARFIAFLARLDHVSGQVFTLDSRLRCPEVRTDFIRQDLLKGSQGPRRGPET